MTHTFNRPKSLVLVSNIKRHVLQSVAINKTVASGLYKGLY